jgi:phosphohistidine phosphatase SixA
MELFVIRHAKAADRDPEAWPDDSQRPLTREGAKEFERVARCIREWRPSVDMVLSSGFVRAWDTARILRANAGWPKPIQTKLLESTDVGHEPMLSELVVGLAGERGGMRLDLRKGAVAWLRGEPGSMSLRGLLVPAMLRGA